MYNGGAGTTASLRSHMHINPSINCISDIHTGKMHLHKS